MFIDHIGVIPKIVDIQPWQVLYEDSRLVDPDSSVVAKQQQSDIVWLMLDSLIR